MKDIHTILSVPLYPTIPPPVWTDGIVFLLGVPTGTQDNCCPCKPVCALLGIRAATSPPKESRLNLGRFPRPWTVGQWGPRRNPAKRFRWGKEEQRNEQVFALPGGNEGYVACDDEKQEKGEGSQAPPLRPTNARSAGIFTGVKQGVVNSKILPQGWRDSPYP